MTGLLRSGGHDYIRKVWLPSYGESGIEEERPTIPGVRATIPEISEQPGQPQGDLAASSKTGNH
jgi:hypothetical protein